MTLTEEQKQDIYNIIKSSNISIDKTTEKYKTLGQFFTPAHLCIKMLEASPYTYEEFINSDILDPNCGTGNLLVAALAVGVDSSRLFGNEYDPALVDSCRTRINKVCDMLGKPHINDWQIHQGNTLQKRCLTEFGPEYEKGYNINYIDDLDYAQTDNDWAWENEQAAQRNKVGE